MSNNLRYFTILPDVALSELDGRPACDSAGRSLTESHVQFIRGRCVDPAFVSDSPKDANTVHWTMVALVSAQTIIAKTVDLRPGATVALDETDWLRLKRSVELGVTYNPTGAMACIPFMREIVGARTEKS